MARKTTKKKDNSKKAGLIGFGAALLLYAVIFSFNGPLDYIVGGAFSALAGWIIKTMATPLKGLDKNAKSKEALDVTIIKDDYARSVIEKGVQMLDALKEERDAINEYVFTRRINEIRASLDKVLRNVMEDPRDAASLRKMNSYYLPTAVKLLQSYRAHKQQGASYMTVSSTREDVLSMLDQLNEALKKTLEVMLKNDLEDMDIEIDVFEQMLKADGLKEDEVTGALRDSAHKAAREVPVSQAPTVKPSAQPAKPVQQKPVQQPVKPVQQVPVQQPVKPAQQSRPTPVPEARYKPEGVTMDYEVPVEEPVSTPVPYLNVPTTTASARQLQQGAPVLQVPQSPSAPDFTENLNQQSKV